MRSGDNSLKMDSWESGMRGIFGQIGRINQAGGVIGEAGVELVESI